MYVRANKGLGIEGRIVYYTMTTASLAAIARISAQETVPGQNSSSSLLAVSITSNPPRDLFAGSARSEADPSTSTDASHPYSAGFRNLYVESSRNYRVQYYHEVIFLNQFQSFVTLHKTQQLI